MTLNLTPNRPRGGTARARFARARGPRIGNLAVRPEDLGAGTASTLVVTLADHVLAFDARTGGPVWSLPASRLPAHAVRTGVRVVDGMVWLEVTQGPPAELAAPAAAGTTTAGGPFGPLARPLCLQPHLVVVNRT